MKSYKKLDKPSGIFGIAFEDWGIFLSVTLAMFFVINLLRNIIDLPKTMYPVALVMTVVLFVILKRANKQKVPMYLHSQIAWFFTPKKIHVIRLNPFTHDQFSKSPSAEKKRKGAYRSDTHL